LLAAAPNRTVRTAVVAFRSGHGVPGSGRPRTPPITRVPWTTATRRLRLRRPVGQSDALDGAPGRWRFVSRRPGPDTHARPLAVCTVPTPVTDVSRTWVGGRVDSGHSPYRRGKYTVHGMLPESCARSPSLLRACTQGPSAQRSHVPRSPNPAIPGSSLPEVQPQSLSMVPERVMVTSVPSIMRSLVSVAPPSAAKPPLAA